MFVRARMGCCRCDDPVIADGVFSAGGQCIDANFRGGATYRYQLPSYSPILLSSLYQSQSFFPRLSSNIQISRGREYECFFVYKIKKKVYRSKVKCYL